MPGRSFSSGTEYRYGYNKGSEKDDEISGAGNSFTTKYRQGDTRLLRWWSVDPKADLQPWQSPYSYMDGNPVGLNDSDGDGNKTKLDIIAPEKKD
jgi:RHS repeat-associated protein